MFQIDTNYAKLKTNLRLAIERLKLLGKKKTELAQKARKEIADYIAAGKTERAKIRVEYIIREDYMVEALELLEMYCDILLSRFGLITQNKGIEPSLAEAISSLLWVAPHLASDVSEMKTISDQLTIKYGKKYTEACRLDAVETISEKLKHKMSVQAPPKILVENYLIEIAKIYNVPYTPDPQVMKEADQAKGVDALLFGNGDNNLGGDTLGPRPPGFKDYPPPPLVPNNFQPFAYPNLPEKSVNLPPMQPFLPPAAFSYNIPPPDDLLPSYDSAIKPTNLPQNFPSNHPQDLPSPYRGDNSQDFSPMNQPGPAMPQPPHQNNLPNVPNNLHTTDRNKQSNQVPKPLPRAKLSPSDNLPELPSVPSDIIAGGSSHHETSDDIDFDDLARRFEELKKRQ
uniref:IST1 homolog n=1 Tax=Homalodisca liturata TaxID=320908 RepID=A0A1B6IVH5_9HEMI